MSVTGYLNGELLPEFSVPFKENIIENAVDVVVLSGAMYTDFVNQRNSYDLRWDVLSLEEYEDLRAIYDAQFTNGEYPEFTCAYYELEDVPCRMYINSRDVRVIGCEVWDVEVKLVKSGTLNNGTSS